MFHALAQRARKWFGTPRRIEFATLGLAFRKSPLSRGVYLTIQRFRSGFVSQCVCDCVCVRATTKSWQDVLLHECAPAFRPSLLLKYLPRYSMHQPHDETTPSLKPMAISPHCFGWPAHRPRSYVVFVNNDTCELALDNLAAMHVLFRKPVVPVEAFFCAPEAHYHHHLCCRCWKCALT